MATPTSIRAGLQVRLATIAGLRAYTRWPDTINAPAALVLLDQASFDIDMGGSVEYRPRVLILAAPVSQGLDKAQALLDTYLAPAGATSVKAAIEGDKTLGGEAQTLSVNGYEGYGEILANGIPYIGAHVVMQVWAR